MAWQRLNTAATTREIKGRWEHGKVTLFRQYQDFKVAHKIGVKY
jgi:hypothetical protein